MALTQLGAVLTTAPPCHPSIFIDRSPDTIGEVSAVLLFDWCKKQEALRQMLSRSQFRSCLKKKKKIHKNMINNDTHYSQNNQYQCQLIKSKTKKWSHCYNRSELSFQLKNFKLKLGHFSPLAIWRKAALLLSPFLHVQSPLSLLLHS